MKRNNLIDSTEMTREDICNTTMIPDDDKTMFNQCIHSELNANISNY